MSEENVEVVRQAFDDEALAPVGIERP